MLRRVAVIGLSAVITLSPLTAVAEVHQQLAQAAPAAAPTGSYGSQMRHRSNLSKERARASAEHMRKMRHASHKTAPTTAPKT
jgi:hypothetical protein